MMRIGFDAKRAFHNATGLGNYSRTLIRSLAEYFPENEYVLFNPKPSLRYSLTGPGIREVLPEGFFNRAFPAWWRTSGITKELSAHGLDLYHGLSHEIPKGIQKTGIPSIVTIHDLIFELFPKQFNPVDVQIYRQKFRYACRYSDLVIAISEQTKKDILTLYGIPEEKVRVCYQSCHPEFFTDISPETMDAVRQRYRLPDNFFLYVGSIIERKNLHRIIEAMAIAGRDNILPLVIIGKGDKYRKKVESVLEQSGMKDLVIFLSEANPRSAEKNLVDGNDLPAIYRSATALVYPSLYEGFGIPVLEALASGTPVITSNTSCLPEAGGRHSLYVDPLDPASIANAMRKILSDSGLVLQMTEKGKEHARQFSRKKSAECVMKLYAELTDRK